MAMRFLEFPVLFFIRGINLRLFQKKVSKISEVICSLYFCSNSFKNIFYYKRLYFLLPTLLRLFFLAPTLIETKTFNIFVALC